MSEPRFLKDPSVFGGPACCQGRTVRACNTGFLEKTCNSVAPVNRSLRRVNPVSRCAKATDVQARDSLFEELEVMAFLDCRGDRNNDQRAGQAIRRAGRALVPGVEALEARALLAGNSGALLPIGIPATAGLAPTPANTTTLSTSDVQTLLQRAARATASDNAIVAVVDRGGNLLGVRVEGNVSPQITGNSEKLVFAIDGAIAEARTGAFFANNQAPLTSRTIQDIAQSTMTQREIQSDPNINDPNSTLAGPGFVAPIGKKAHFPPRVMWTPQVDLQQIEQTNRDSIISNGADQIRGTADDTILPNRFNVPSQFIPAGDQSLPAGFQKTNPTATPDNPPESYGLISGLLPTAQSRGIGTLPGGIPLYKNGVLVGGIGVFFPGTTGFATEENSSLNDAGFFDPTKPDLSQEAEYIAFVAAGGSKGAGFSYNTPQVNAKFGLPSFPAGDNFDLPFGRIDLVGISLDIFGGHGRQGPSNLVAFGKTLGLGDTNSGTNKPVDRMGDTLLPGVLIPQGWLVIPHDAPDGSLTAADVTAIVERGVSEANQVRAAIRLPLNSTAKMIFAVTDKAGNVLGLYRMPDATFFSIAVAVAKARNASYYADPNQLQAIDQVPGLPKGVAMTARTFRYLASPRFPVGIDINPPGPFSILNETGVRENGPPQTAASFQTVEGYTAFNPQANFHDPFNITNQNGVVFFPGSAPLYKDISGNGQKVLVGGLGVSGDGVDQDDDVTFQAAVGFEPPPNVPRADQVFVRNVRLPYQKFNRQPHVPLFAPPLPVEKVQPILLPGKHKTLTAADIHRIKLFNAQAIQAVSQEHT
jgi:uncharacterized protein GlcG (DUF336 family)